MFSPSVGEGFTGNRVKFGEVTVDFQLGFQSENGLLVFKSQLEKSPNKEVWNWAVDCMKPSGASPSLQPEMELDNPYTFLFLVERETGKVKRAEFGKPP